MRIDGSLFFGSVAHVENLFDQQRAAHPGQKHLAILADGINFVDLQGAEALAREAVQRQADGGALYLINVKKGMWDALNRYGSIETIGWRNIFQTKEAAIRAIYQKLDKAICASCSQPVFIECQAGSGSPLVKSG
jgi:SulP family sulfate permease